ncbi:MAG TPA: hypothetical protein VL326_14005 [Kofleriaceae bacterium]|nr:hypothetical protein [Kofleriaceae bacterium]
MYSRCPWILLAAGVFAGCQGKQPAPPPPAPTVIEVKDADGHVVAELRPIRPCRGTVPPAGELIVGGPPILATEGSAQWTGATGSNGTTYEKDGERLARLYPINDPINAAVLDMHGVAQMRIAIEGDVAIVRNGAGMPVRNLKKVAAGSAGPEITSDSPALTISGTDDLVLAGLLSAPELVPQIRILAACERVLAKGS